MSNILGKFQMWHEVIDLKNTHLFSVELLDFKSAFHDMI